VAEVMGATFFSNDPSGWPNFATIVTTDGPATDGPATASG
jgi:hypothetical protein